MCGIAGIVELKSSPQPHLIQRMTDQLTHRGPDHGDSVSYPFQEYWMGLGHRRLSVIDLSSQANQPMEYNALTIVFNGEIYNFKALRQTLEQLGHSFKTSSDTEVLLHAFRAWGMEMIQRLNGMFAIAIFDKENHRLTLIRDRFGVKPLCYYIENGLFLFASESKAFHVHPRFKKKIERSSLARYFQYGNIPAPASIFENVSHVLPGTLVEINTLDLSLNATQYWDPVKAYQQPTAPVGFEEAKEKTRILLQSAVAARLVSDVPVGLFLSGGYDSATTAGIVAPLVPNLRTFTVSVPDAGLNEGPKAKAIANYLSTQHTEVECSLNEALAIIPKLPTLYDEPFADSSAIPTYLVAREAVKSVKVALSADGGDELFAGYNRYLYAHRIPKALTYIHPFFLRILGSAMKGSSIGEGLLAQRMGKVGRWLENPTMENYMEAMTKLHSDKEISSYLKEDLSLSEIHHPIAATPLGQMLLMDTIGYLPNDILHKVDRATMAVGLEGREPLLDFELMTYLASLPDRFKCDGKESKILLKSIAHDLIPPQLLQGPKKGFAIPINPWMRTHLRKPILEMVDPLFLKTQGIFNEEKVCKEVLQFLNGKVSNGLFTWYYFNFQMWYRQWMH